MNEQRYTNVGDAVKNAMAAKGFSQEMLGRRLYELGDDPSAKKYAQSAVSERLRKPDMKVGTLADILKIIGCDLVILDTKYVSVVKAAIAEAKKAEMKQSQEEGEEPAEPVPAYWTVMSMSEPAYKRTKKLTIQKPKSEKK